MDRLGQDGSQQAQNLLDGSRWRSKAAEATYPVMFDSATNWITRLADAHAHNRLATELKRLHRYWLLVVDEVEYLPFDAASASLFFQMGASRYETGSIVLTSNLVFGGGETLGDDVVAAATIDRLVHHAHVVALDGESYRTRAHRPGPPPAANNSQYSSSNDNRRLRPRLAIFTPLNYQSRCCDEHSNPSSNRGSRLDRRLTKGERSWSRLHAAVITARTRRRNKIWAANVWHPDRMRNPWPWRRWHDSYQTLVAADDAPGSAADHLTTRKPGTVTAAHEELLRTLATLPDAPWSSRALWSCLDQLRSAIIAGSEVRVEQAWTDGPMAFCIVYNPPYQSGNRVGLRRQINDTDPADYEPNIGAHYAAFLSPIWADVGPDSEWDPIGFGQIVAGFDIDEPLGNANDALQTDSEGIGWWGALQSKLPRPPQA